MTRFSVKKEFLYVASQTAAVTVEASKVIWRKFFVIIHTLLFTLRTFEFIKELYLSRSRLT